MMKRIAVAATIVVVAAVAAAGVLGAFAPTAAAATPTSSEATGAVSSRYVTVVGQGKTSVKPDIASLNVGVETKAAEVGDAMAENAETMETVLEALDDAGIAEKDIRTSAYNIYFDEGFRGPEVEQEPVYRVSNMVIVTIRDLDAVGEVLDAVVAAGANRIYGVNFTLEDWSEAQAEARAEAVADAKERAEQLAGLADVELGQVISISEVIGGAGVPVPERAVGLGGGGPISPGQLEYSTNIQVTYAIE